MVATVSDKPWRFSQADYTPAQWERACLIDTGQGATTSKDRYKLPVREPDGTLNRNGVHAAAGGHGVSQLTGVSSAQRSRAAAELVSFYRNDLHEDPPESLMSLAGTAPATRSEPVVYRRWYALEDIHVVRSGEGGDGRTVEAYAAVFDSPARIVDDEGEYMEEIDRTAFNRAIDHARRSGSGGGWNVRVLYNHGYTVQGTPSERFSIPIGVPVDIRPESRGLLTRTRYSETPLGEEILETIRSGGITSQSFSGRIVRSTPQLRRGEKHRNTGGQLTRVRRMELGLREYGPTPFPAYSDAEIIGVRMSTPRYDSDPNVEPDDEATRNTDPDDRTIGTGAESPPATDDPPAAGEDSIRDAAHRLYVLRSREMLEKEGIRLP